MLKCEHCGVVLKSPDESIKWELCPACKILDDDAGTTREMVEFACEVNATLTRTLEELYHAYRNKLTVENLTHLTEDDVTATKHLFDTESANWELWETRCAELYTDTHDGTMYHVGVVALRNANIKARIALMHERCEELT